VPGGAPWKVRFAFWTGEETGLLGSLAYVGQLGPEGESSIEAYVNLDMIGSTNGIREVYEGDATGSPNGSNAIEALLGQGLTDQQATWALANIGGASDHTAFDQIGVPVSGIFSGASARVTASQAVLFGAIAGQPADPCYHLVCDTPANIDREWLEQNARAAAWALGRLASGEVVIPAG
jgi:Zn-dependent M28 family amino/carboxypeptidase